MAALGVLILLVGLIQIVLLSVGVPLGFLDGRLYYPAEEIHRVLVQQGEAGRLLYGQLETIDLLFILVYTWLLVELTRRLRLKAKWRVPAYLAFLPIGVATASDAVETVGILSLLSRFPEQAPELERLISWATPIKWLGLFFAILQVAFLLAQRLIKPKEATQSF